MRFTIHLQTGVVSYLHYIQKVSPAVAVAGDIPTSPCASFVGVVGTSRHGIVGILVPNSPKLFSFSTKFFLYPSILEFLGATLDFVTCRCLLFCVFDGKTFAFYYRLFYSCAVARTS